jgi:hypothetical protein
LYNPSRAGPAYLHPVYPDIIHFLNYPDILVFSGGAFPLYFSVQIQDRPMSKPHNIWQSTGNDPISIKSGEIKSKLVTQSYMLQNIKLRYNKNISSICTLCGAGPAYLHPVYPDIIHFLNYPDILVFSGGAFPLYFSD